MHLQNKWVSLSSRNSCPLPVCVAMWAVHGWDRKHRKQQLSKQGAEKGWWLVADTESVTLKFLLTESSRLLRAAPGPTCRLCGWLLPCRHFYLTLLLDAGLCVTKAQLLSLEGGMARNGVSKWCNSYLQSGKVKVLSVKMCPCLDKTWVLYLLNKCDNRTLYLFKYEN